MNLSIVIDKFLGKKSYDSIKLQYIYFELKFSGKCENWYRANVFLDYALTNQNNEGGTYKLTNSVAHTEPYSQSDPKAMNQYKLAILSPLSDVG